MFKIFKYSMLFVFVVATGCANYFKRQECEKINWFNHGQDLALSGQRINEDDMYLSCKKAEAEINESQLDMGWKSGRQSYCTPEGATLTGKKGKPLKLDFCDSGSIKTLKERHASGVRYFCHPKNAYTFGASGGVYNKICPENMEASFQVGYKKGRKKYLAEMVRQSHAKVQNMDSEIREQERRKTTSAIMLATIPAPVIISGAKETVTVQDPNESRRTQLKQDISSIDYKINQLESQKKLENSKMLEYQRELNTMESDSDLEKESMSNDPSVE